LRVNLWWRLNIVVLVLGYFRCKYVPFRRRRVESTVKQPRIDKLELLVIMLLLLLFGIRLVVVGYVLGPPGESASSLGEREEDEERSPGPLRREEWVIANRK